jgi:hypothetical protein
LEQLFLPSICILMSTESGSCTLIIDGQRHVGFQYVAEMNEGSTKWCGFVSGPAKVLKRARLMTPVGMEFAGGSPTDVSILPVHDSGLALISFDRNAPASNRIASVRQAGAVMLK